MRPLRALLRRAIRMTRVLIPEACIIKFALPALQERDRPRRPGACPRGLRRRYAARISRSLRIWYAPQNDSPCALIRRAFYSPCSATVAGALTANLGLLPGSRAALNLGGARYDLGTRKLGAAIGDHSQLGCHAVTDPGAMIGRNVAVYALRRVPRGVYGPNEILKCRARNERAHFEVLRSG